MQKTRDKKVPQKVHPEKALFLLWLPMFKPSVYKNPHRMIYEPSYKIWVSWNKLWWWFEPRITQNCKAIYIGKKSSSQRLEKSYEKSNSSSKRVLKQFLPILKNFSSALRSLMPHSCHTKLTNKTVFMNQLILASNSHKKYIQIKNISVYGFFSKRKLSFYLM